MLNLDVSYFENQMHLQPRNYQVSKEVVHKLEFKDVAAMQI